MSRTLDTEDIVRQLNRLVCSADPDGGPRVGLFCRDPHKWYVELGITGGECAPQVGPYPRHQWNPLFGPFAGRIAGYGTTADEAAQLWWEYYVAKLPSGLCLRVQDPWFCTRGFTYARWNSRNRCWERFESLEEALHTSAARSTRPAPAATG